MENNSQKVKRWEIAFIAIVAIFILAVGSVGAQQGLGGGDGTINTLDQMKGTTTPYIAVTTRTYAKNLYFPGSWATTTGTVADTLCLTGDSCITSWSAGTADGTFSTTSADVWKDNRNFFSTTSQVAWNTLNRDWSVVNGGYLKPTTTIGFIVSASSTVNGQFTAKSYLDVLGDTTGTSTFYGNVEVKGNLRDDSISSALLFGDGIGEVVEYSGTTCTNQFVRSLNGAGVATCETVSLTADVTGTLPVANGGTGSTTLSTNLLKGNGTGVVNSFAGTSCTNQFVRSLNGAGVATCDTVALVTDSDIATAAPTLTGTWAFAGTATTTFAKGIYALQIAAPYFNATSTTATSTFAGGIRTNNGGLFISSVGSAILSAVSGIVRELGLSAAFSLSSNSLSSVAQPSFDIASSTAWTGTTTRMLQRVLLAETINQVKCKVLPNGATLNVHVGYGAATTTMITASSTDNIINFSANNTPSAGNGLIVSIGTPAGSPNEINCTFKITI